MREKRKAATEKRERGAIPVDFPEDGNLEKALAKATVRPTVQAARTLFLSQGDQHTVIALTNELSSQVRASMNGSTERSESMLIAQAHVLDELFNVLTRRALVNFNGAFLDAGERYMRLALKAQSQARTTLETLTTIKNPPIFAKQANIAHGPQQVNNGADFESSMRTRARETVEQPSELLERKQNETMDAAATCEAILVDRKSGGRASDQPDLKR